METPRAARTNANGQKGRLSIVLAVGAVAFILIMIGWVIVSTSQHGSMTKDREGQAAIQRTFANPAVTNGTADTAKTQNGGAKNGNGDQGTATLGTTYVPNSSAATNTTATGAQPPK